MIGGYATVAAELNKRFAPQPPIDRRVVYNWDRRQTRNHAGQLPPNPVETRHGVPRSTPTRLFETEPWVGWFAAGVRGPRRRGWRVWLPVDPDVTTLARSGIEVP